MPTKIEWTHGPNGEIGETWNPLAGCTPVSSGCANCFAARMAKRLVAMGQKKYQGTVDEHGRWTGQLNTDETALVAPLRWKKPRRVFVNSMSDLFHETVPFDFIDLVFAVMALCPQHTFQVLTKRPERMLEYLTARTPRTFLTPGLEGEEIREVSRAWCIGAAAKGAYMTDRRPSEYKRFIRVGTDLQMSIAGSWPIPNVWLGTSVENQSSADERIPALLACPARIRFLSCEPLLGPIDLERGGFALNRRIVSPSGKRYPGLQWVICGGESGAKARPMHPDWARGLRDQCAAARVPFFFKQWGEWVGEDEALSILVDEYLLSKTRYTIQHNEIFYRVGKKSAGRLLDGVVHDGCPKVAL